MKNLNLITRIGFLVFILVACQKGSKVGGLPQVTLQQAALTIDCGSLSQSEIQNAQLLGPDVVGQNKTAAFSLAGVSGCGSYQKLMTFSDPGIYQVSANLKTATQTVQLQAVTQVVGSSLQLTGPVVAVEGLPVTFSLSNPENLVISSVAWDFGDGAVSSSGMSVTTVYNMPGDYLVSVVATFADGSSKHVTHALTVVPLEDSFLCVKGFKVVAPATGVTGEIINMSVFLPTCLQGRVTHVAWDLGDSSSTIGLSITHIYQQEGTYSVIVSVYHPDTDVLWFNYPLQIDISPSVGSTTTTTLVPVTTTTLPEITTTTLEPVTTTTLPSTTTTTLPPVCVEGVTRDILQPVTSATLQCGVSGHQTTDSQVVITEQCQYVGGVLGYYEISRQTRVVRVGICEGQSCQLPDGSFIRDGDSRLMYSTELPAGSCSIVSQVRTCQNGSLLGSVSYSYLNCANGCENFGPSGTVKAGIVTGQTQVALVCPFGEPGVFDLFNQVVDQSCQAGTVVTSNSRIGDLISKGQCPTYSWVGTVDYSTCTAACGGTQTRIYQCKDAAGNLALPDRCGTLVAETRACDGDPAAVRKVETSSKTEEANSSAVCPKNQIGVVVNQRDVTTTNTYSCINHSVQLESSVTTASPWVEERYCRDYVAHRCSQDSLDNTQAKKRLEWMIRCSVKVPVIKEFLDHFASVEGKADGGKYSLTTNGRMLYATFMDHAFNPEKPWIAPKGDGDDDEARGHKKSCGVKHHGDRDDEGRDRDDREHGDKDRDDRDEHHGKLHDDKDCDDNDECKVPGTVYVAAVCVSSCATPEEQILAQEVASGKLAGVTFIQALTQKFQFVGTLASHSGMSSRELKKTKVDQWVTELLDTEHQILEFRMASGGLLKVTPNHPLVSEQGKMKIAGDFKAGESLVKLGGVMDPIISIKQVVYFGKVYNVFVKSDDPIKNVVVTNGYLNGTAFYQNEGSKHLNRVIFRERVTKGVFE